MTTFTRTEWVIAEALADPQTSFALWMIGTGLCGSRAEFERHFGPGFPPAELLEEAVDAGLLAERDGRLRLTALGEAVTDELGLEDASAEAIPAPAVQPPAQGMRTAEARGGQWRDDAILSVLRRHWSDEMDLVGRPVVMDLLRRRAHLEASTGARADYSGFLAVLAEAVGLLGAALGVAEAALAAGGALPAPDDVLAAVRARPDAGPENPRVPSDALVADLLRWLAAPANPNDGSDDA